MNAIRTFGIVLVTTLTIGPALASCSPSSDPSNASPSASESPSASSSPSASEVTEDTDVSDPRDDVEVSNCALDVEMDGRGSSPAEREYPSPGLWPFAEVTVTNNSDKTSDYKIEITFESTGKEGYDDSQVAIIKNLKPGQTKRKKVTGFSRAPSDNLTCDLSDVDRIVSK